MLLTIEKNHHNDEYISNSSKLNSRIKDIAMLLEQFVEYWLPLVNVNVDHIILKLNQ